MYLKKLYQHNKFWFLVVIFFITAQLFINYKRGVVFSPFFHYGMYSGVIKPVVQYEVPEIFVNGKQLATKDFTPIKWENISFPVSQFYTQKQWNKLLWQRDIHRLLPFTDSSKFRNLITEPEFQQWYKTHLQSVLGEKAYSVEILISTYTFDGKSLHKIKSVPPHEQ